MGVTYYFDPGDKWRRIQAMLDDPTAPLDALGVTMVATSQEAFDEQGWAGKKWPERMTPNFAGIIRDLMEGSPEPKPGRTKKGPALMDSGTLMGSIAYNRISANAIIVGSNVEYAEKHASGGESKVGPWTQSVRAKLWKWLKRQSDDTRGELSWLLSKKWLKEPVIINVQKRKFVGLTPDAVEAVEKTIAEA